MISDRESNLFNAILAQETRRYDDMLQFVRPMALLKNELTVEENELLTAAFKETVAVRRRSLVIIEQIEERQQLVYRNNNNRVIIIKRYREKIEKELIDICQEFVHLLDNHLLPMATTDESKIYCYKKNGDFNRYLAAIVVKHNNYDNVCKKALASYEEGYRIACASLPTTHPLLLGIALNFSVFYATILDDRHRARKLAQQTLDNAIVNIGTIRSESFYDDTITVLGLLRENINIWTEERCEINNVNQ